MFVQTYFRFSMNQCYILELCCTNEKCSKHFTLIYICCGKVIHSSKQKHKCKPQKRSFLCVFDVREQKNTFSNRVAGSSSLSSAFFLNTIAQIQNSCFPFNNSIWLGVYQAWLYPIDFELSVKTWPIWVKVRLLASNKYMQKNCVTFDENTTFLYCVPNVNSLCKITYVNLVQLRTNITVDPKFHCHWHQNWS